MLKSAILEDTPSDVNKFLISLSELDDNLNGKNISINETNNNFITIMLHYQNSD